MSKPFNGPQIGRRMRAAMAEIAMRPGVLDVVIDRTHGRHTTDRLIKWNLARVQHSDQGRRVFLIDRDIDLDHGSDPDSALKIQAKQEHERLRDLVIDRDGIRSITCPTCNSTPYYACVSSRTGLDCGPHYDRLIAYLGRLLERHPDLEDDFFKPQPYIQQ